MLKWISAGLRTVPGGQAGLGLAWPCLAQPERLDFPKGFQGFGIPKPKGFPARFARRKRFIFIIVCKLFGSQNPNFLRRASLAGNFLFPEASKVSEPLFGVWYRPANSGQARAGV